MDDVDNAINVVSNAGHSSAKQEQRELCSMFHSDAATVLFTWISSVHYNFESVFFWNILLSTAAAVLYPALS